MKGAKGYSTYGRYKEILAMDMYEFQDWLNTAPVEELELLEKCSKITPTHKLVLEAAL